MRNVFVSTTLAAEQLYAEPVRLGVVPADHSPPEHFVCVVEDDKVLLRVDLYHNAEEAHAFVNAIEWQGNVIIGWGERLYLVNPRTKEVRQHLLGSYFGSLYPTEAALFVASAERVFRIQLDGNLQWTSDILGLDGVLIHDIHHDSLSGDGEWDAPGGWRSFAINAQTGALLPSDA